MDESFQAGGGLAPLPAPETLAGVPESLAALRALRAEGSQARAFADVGSALAENVRTIEPLDERAYDLLNEYGLSGWEEGSLTAPWMRDRLSILGSCFGTPDAVAQLWRLGNDQEASVRAPQGGASLRFKGYGGGQIGWSIRLDDTLDADGRAAAIRTLQEGIREQQLPIAQAQAELSDARGRGELYAYSSQSFAWSIHGDTMMAFLAAGANHIPEPRGLRISQTPGPDAYRTAEVEAFFSGMPAHHPGDVVSGAPAARAGVHYDEQGNITRIVAANTTNPGAYLVLAADRPGIDISELSFHMGYEVVPSEAGAAIGYNAGEYFGDVVSFAESYTAVGLFGALDAAGLRFNGEVLGMLAELGSVRYGHGYSDLTREVAKLVDDPQRSLTRLFDGDEAAIREGILRLQDIESPAAQVVVELLRGVVNRNSDSSAGVVLPGSPDRIDMRDGSCKDIEYYFADGGVYEQADDGGSPLFVVSSYKVPTFMTLRPTVLNGVVLPQGSLLTRRPDGSYLFMRVTGFAFDDQQALDAFGPQEAANRKTAYGYGRQSIRARLSA